MAVQQVQNLPPQFIQDLGKDLGTQIVAQTGVPVVSQGIGSLTQQTGEDATQFKARQDAAKQFSIKFLFHIFTWYRWLCSCIRSTSR